jgi:hypothetical protein
MVQPAGKHLPFWVDQPGHDPHRSNRGQGAAGGIDSAGEWRGGLRRLPALRTESGSGAGGAGTTSSSRGDDLKGGLARGWYVLMSSEIRDEKQFDSAKRNQERFMTKQLLKNFAFAMVLLGLQLIPSAGLAQVGSSPKLPGKHLAPATARMTGRQMQTPGSPSYTYTLLSFPGSLSTFAEGINLGATTSKIEIVGGAGEGGFLVRVTEKKTVTEAYQAVNYPHGSDPQTVAAVNDSGQMVGEYADYEQGYERSGGRFTPIAVPFAGAAGTFPYGINNSGEVVGGWWDSNIVEHGFTLIGGAYTSVDYPGASETGVFGVNSAGDLVGGYNDASGVPHGFLLSGGTYTSFDFPGAGETDPYAINDSGDIVGLFCATTKCPSGLEGAQGFLLSQGVFTTIAIPGEVYTYASGINNNGVVLGNYQDAAGLAASFLATP